MQVGSKLKKMKIKSFLPTTPVLVIVLFALLGGYAFWDTPLPPALRPYLEWAGGYASPLLLFSTVIIGSYSIVGLCLIVIKYDDWRNEK